MSNTTTTQSPWADALVSGNWGSVITAGFALFSYVFYTWLKK